MIKLFKNKKSTTPPMGQNSPKSSIKDKIKHHKGSLLIEAIIMLGLVAALTPLLYGHVSERRKDLDNINQANVLLLLKNATNEYIQTNKDAILASSEDKILLKPSDLNTGADISDSRYAIGIRKDVSGSEPAITAMVISLSGGNNDLQAAKVANLMGVSGGIYSAADADRAWGINGLWADNINYYFADSIKPATGSAVVTTAYDKETSGEVYLSKVIVDADLEMGEFGINTPNMKVANTCRDASGGAIPNCTPTPSEFTGDHSHLYYHDTETVTGGYLELPDYSKLQLGDSSQICMGEHCAYGLEGLTNTNRCDAETPCPTGFFCVNNRCIKDPTLVIEACNAGDGEMCAEGYKGNLNRTCNEVFLAYNNVGKALPANPWTLRLATSESGAYKSRVCYFTANAGYQGWEVVEACNNDTALTCALGYNRTLNRTCQNVAAEYQKDGKTATQGIYKLSTSSAGAIKRANCYISGANGYNGIDDIVVNCKNNNSTYCNLGWTFNVTRNCHQIRNEYTIVGQTFTEGTFRISTTASANVEALCALYGTNLYSITTACTGTTINGGACCGSDLRGVYTGAMVSKPNVCPGRYQFDVRGAAVVGNGGYTYAIYQVPTGKTFQMGIYGVGGARGGGTWSGAAGGDGYGVYVGTNLLAVAGGAGGGGTYCCDGSPAPTASIGGGGNLCGTNYETNSTGNNRGGKAGCNGVGGAAGSNGGSAGTATNGGRGSSPCDNGGGGGGGGYGGGGGGGCTLGGTVGPGAGGGGGGGGYLRTSGVDGLTYVSGGGIRGENSGAGRVNITFLP